MYITRFPNISSKDLKLFVVLIIVLRWSTSTSLVLPGPGVKILCKLKPPDSLLF